MYISVIYKITKLQHLLVNMDEGDSNIYTITSCTSKYTSFIYIYTVCVINISVSYISNFLSAFIVKKTPTKTTESPKPKATAVQSSLPFSPSKASRSRTCASDEKKDDGNISGSNFMITL